MNVPRVYVLGAGAIGSLLAHEIAKLPVQTAYSIPQVVMLLRNENRLNEYLNQESRITINSIRNQHKDSHSVQTLAGTNPPRTVEGGPTHIQNLILSTKIHHTADSLEPFIPNLTADSNVLLVQNGLGLVEQLYERYWPNPEERPNFYQGILTHGVYRLGNSFFFNHVGHGDLKISSIPRNLESFKLNDEVFDEAVKPDLIHLLAQSPVLNTTWMPFSKLRVFQYEKLVVNACINPLTAIYDCFNGELMNMSNLTSTLIPIIREAVQVIYKTSPFLEDVPTAHITLDEDRLLQTVLRVIEVTKKNSSSMREDIKRNQTTEIDYINGFIAKQGTKLGISAGANRMLLNMVKNKQSLDNFRNDGSIKFAI